MVTVGDSWCQLVTLGVFIGVFTGVFIGVFTDVFTGVFIDLFGVSTDVFTGVFIDLFGVFTDVSTGTKYPKTPKSTGQLAHYCLDNIIKNMSQFVFKGWGDAGARLTIRLTIRRALGCNHMAISV